MQRALEHGRAVLRRVLIIGMCVQVVLGLGWILANLGKPAEFGMENGVLYPLILKIIMGMAQFLHIPYYCIVHLLQLGAAFMSDYALLHSLGGWKKRQKVLGALVMLTVPMALQCHLGILPNSFAVSLLITELSFSIELMKRKDDIDLRDILLPCVCWILAGLTMREYMLFGAVPVVVAGAYLTVAGLRKKKCFLYWLVMVATILSLGGLYMVRENNPLDSSDISLKQVVVGRCIWSSIPYTYSNWPEELQAVVPQKVATDAYLRPEQMRDEFFDVFEKLEEDLADQYYGIMLEQAFQMRWKSILLEFIYDMAGYTVPGPMVDLQLNGLGHYSVTATNYLAWVSWNETIAGFMMQYYVYWCLASTAIVVLLGVSGPLLQQDKIQQPKNIIFATCVSIVGIMLLQAVYYTLTEVGLYDYKLVAWAAIMWCMPVTCIVNKKLGKVR